MINTDRFNYTDGELAADHFVNFICDHTGGSLTNYHAKPFIMKQLLKLTNGATNEYPFHESVLGVTVIDDRGAMVTVNQNTKNQYQKLFTYAHELCHMILDREYLRVNKGVDMRNPDGISGERRPREIRANRFAARVLLPDAVLDADMRGFKTIYGIRATQGASLEAIQYRVQEYLEQVYFLTPEQAVRLSKKYYEARNDYDTRPFNIFWKRLYNPSSATMSAIACATRNRDLAQRYLDPDLVAHRKHKKEIIKLNRERLAQLQYDYETGMLQASNWNF